MIKKKMPTDIEIWAAQAQLNRIKYPYAVPDDVPDDVPELYIDPEQETCEQLDARNSLLSKIMKAMPQSTQEEILEKFEQELALQQELAEMLPFQQVLYEEQELAEE